MEFAVYVTVAFFIMQTEKACILAQLKTLDNEDNQLERILDRKELEDSRKSGLCSSEEELDKLVCFTYCLNPFCLLWNFLFPSQTC